jgi:hypothetical protein
MACSLSSGRLWCARYVGEQALLKAGSGAVRLQMRGVDHDPLRFAILARQFGENLVEHAQAGGS